MKKVLVLGISGMFGHRLFTHLLGNTQYSVHGTVRRRSPWLDHMPQSKIASNIYEGVDALTFDSVIGVFESVRPDIVVNCIGVVKQRPDSADPLVSIPLNSVLPHRLALLCACTGARFIHLSTDCVFSGRKGLYNENDPGDAEDLYGQTKYLGEVRTDTALTIRTSYIGHELSSCHGLVDWFLSQEVSVNGFSKAMYSGLPVIELCEVMERFVFRDDRLSGLLNLSSNPISKFELLQLVARIYGKKIQIEPTDTMIIDRTLDSTRFKNETGYMPSNWEGLIEKMHLDFVNSGIYTDRRKLFGV